MNLKELKYFIAVIDTGNFTDAADICCVTQPTLSAGIKKLEDELDVQLIVRGTKNTGGIRPTICGAKILDAARNIIAESEKIKKIAKKSKNPFSGDLRIGAFPTLCPYIFPRIFPLHDDKMAEMNFYLLEEKTDNLLELLSEDKVDIIFLATEIPASKNLDYKIIKSPLFFDPFYLATSVKHEYATQKTISVSQLDDLNLLLLEEGHCLRNQVLDACSVTKNNFFFKADFRATNMETLLSMVRMGTGATLVPKTLINLDDKLIRYIPISGKEIGRTIEIIYNTQTLDKKVIEICQAFFKNFR